MLQDLRTVERLPLVCLLECAFQVVLYRFIEHCWLLHCERGVIDSRNALGRGKMMKVLSQSLELGSCQFLLVLLCLFSLNLSELLEFSPKMLILGLQSVELCFSHVKVVDVLADKVAPKDLLNQYGLLREVLQILGIILLDLSIFELFAGVVGPEVRFYLDSCCLFPKELFAPHIHSKFGLYFESGCVVSFPLFFRFVGVVVVEFLGQGEKAGAIDEQFHK